MRIATVYGRFDRVPLLLCMSVHRYDIVRLCCENNIQYLLDLLYLSPASLTFLLLLPPLQSITFATTIMSNTGVKTDEKKQHFDDIYVES